MSLISFVAIARCSGTVHAGFPCEVTGEAQGTAQSIRQIGADHIGM